MDPPTSMSALQPSESTELCSVCSNITLVMLFTGFEHPLTYKQAIESGRNCRFCRLMVCSYARLQVPANAYEVEQNYESFIPQLKQSGAVFRHQAPRSAWQGLGPVMETLVEMPTHLCWVRHENWDGVYGTFSGGCTVQVSAPEGNSENNFWERDLVYDCDTDSVYLAEKIISTREIYKANCHRNSSLLYRWLYSCIDDHSQCRQSLSGSNYDDDAGEALPSRVIHVGALDGSTTPRIHVTSGERGKYTVLSHRWGMARKVTTKKENLEEFKRSLPMNELPLTFKDAIQVTSSLGIEYLWIDSLCIIQDDPDDWEREAAQMGSIFERACCTIAAVDAIDDVTHEDKGLFLPRERDPLAVRMSCDWDEDSIDPPSSDDPVWESTYERLPYSVTAAKNRDVVLRPRWKGLWYTVEETTWRTRAWVLQERILSRRIIYYTKRKIFWECQQFSTDEENRPNTVAPLRAQFTSEVGKMSSYPIDAFEDPHMFDFWGHQVEEYSSCLLTKEKDKLAAFKGLCDRVEQRLQQEIFAGVLLDKVGLNLLWRARDKPLEAYTEFHAPSWSWSTLKGAIKYNQYSIAASSRPQIQNLQMNRPDSCLSAKDGGKCRSGVCGILSFDAPFDMATAAETFREFRSHTNEGMIHILGSTVHHESLPIPRQTPSGALNIPRRELSLPSRTQVLRAKRTDDIIGWILLDREISGKEHTDILCVAVTMQQASSMAEFAAYLGPIREYDYSNEQNADFIALQPCVEKASMYQRVGRGSVVARGWIDNCRQKHFNLC